MLRELKSQQQNKFLNYKFEMSPALTNEKIMCFEISASFS